MKTYPSALKASKSRHLFPRTIDRCIRGELKTVKNHMWRRFKKDEIPSQIEPLQKDEKVISIKPVAKVDSIGNIIETYPSLKNASKVNSIDPRILRNILNNKCGSCGNTTYRYLSIEEISKYKYKMGKEISISRKDINQYSLDKKFLRTFSSIREANEYLGKKKDDRGISLCLSGKYKTAYGYIWKYKDFENVKRKETYICSYDENKKLVKKYLSVKDASKDMNVSVSAINNAIRLKGKVKGHTWKRK